MQLQSISSTDKSAEILYCIHQDLGSFSFGDFKRKKMNVKFMHNAILKAAHLFNQVDLTCWL